MPDESSDSDEFELKQQDTEDFSVGNEIFRDIEAKEKFYSQAKSEI